MQKGRYYGACQRRDERCKNRKYKYIREDVVQEVVKQELERLLCPSQSILEWVVESMQSDVEKAADNRAEVEQSTKARIERIKSMDEALYDDKLAGVITQERYEAKHESFMNEIETLELAMASFDSTVSERKRRGIYMLELSQRAAKYYDEKDDDEKRQILIELFENIMFKNDAVSVSLKDRAELIAKYSSKTRELLGTRKSNDRTFTNSENNRGQNNEKSTENVLYPLWQGMHLFMRHNEMFQHAKCGPTTHLIWWPIPFFIALRRVCSRLIDRNDIFELSPQFRKNLLRKLHKILHIASLFKSAQLRKPHRQRRVK